MEITCILLIIILIIILIFFYIFNKLLTNIDNFTNKNEDKINFIDHIVWINLDRSEDRKNHMINLLKDVKINNTRIPAIDGNNIEKYKLENIKYTNYRELSKYEKACTLSHLKSINYLKNIPGNYFMVCEDDITFDNLKYFKKNLKDIIINSPPFDILVIQKTYDKELKNEYEKWIDHYNENPLTHIGGTCSYIISKSGVDKICNRVKYIENENKFLFNDKNDFHVADIYIYINLNTYVYKYNFISALINNSNIHNDHLDFHSSSNNFNLNIIKNNLDKI